jgi:hypothetical protein
MSPSRTVFAAQHDAYTRNVEILKSTKIRGFEVGHFQLSSLGFLVRVIKLCMTPAAISMTMCELKTARYRSLPLECQPFSLDIEDSVLRETPYADCVEFARSPLFLLFVLLTLFFMHPSFAILLFRALSRSAQFWASYSGYLREIRV